MRIIVFLLFLNSSLISCQSILTKIVTDRNIEKKTLIYKNSKGNYLIYLPTVHIGKKHYYNSIKKIIDSLRKDGFVIAYEGIVFETEKKNFEINAKKARKIMGYNIANINYNNSEALPKQYSTKNHIFQNNENTGVKNSDYNVDMHLETLIEKYELKYGNISLSDCDIETPLDAKYKCKTKQKIPKYYFTDELRNNEVVRKISEIDNKNIVLLFGKGHRYILHAGFLNIGYELINGKL